MRHRIKKAKFGFGQDSNSMLIKKLVANFLVSGKMTTTKQKGKAAQSALERLVTKAKTNTQADRNFILRRVTNETVLNTLVKVVGPALKEVKSGYTKAVLLGQRPSDGAQVVRLEWAYPVVLETNKPTNKPTKRQEVEEEKKDKVAVEETKK
jgi:large subunit ribosomal protein L17